MIFLHRCSGKTLMLQKNIFISPETIDFTGVSATLFLTQQKYF
jgi:hypothetical protein